MQTSFVAVLERSLAVTGEAHTEPYEAGWAREARWFVNIEDLRGDHIEIVFYTELSPDGINWCKAADEPQAVGALGLQTWCVREFGQFLRLGCEVAGDEARAILSVHLVLKS